MKFLAMLRDSLREAIDAKVFYVMLGLSGLLILLGSTLTFRPQPGAKMVMDMAGIPLVIDVNNLDPAEFRGTGVDAARVLRRVRGNYKVTEAIPLNGQPDLPGSTFRVVIETGGGGLGGFGFLLGGSKPEEVKKQIRERFGAYDDMRLVNIENIEHEKGKYILTATLTSQGKRLWPHDFSMFYGALPIITQGIPLGMQLYILENVLVNQFGSWITLLVSVVLTAFFIPNMVRKGTVDMLIVKPVRRSTLLLYKFVGGLLFILINTTVAVGGVWLVLGLRTGVWAPGFLLSIPAITFFFVILYSVSTLFAVMTGSPIVCIIMTCLVWTIFFVADVTKTIVDAFSQERQAKAKQNAGRLVGTAVPILSDPGSSGMGAISTLYVASKRLHPLEYEEGWFPPIVRSIHFFLPRTGDMNSLMAAQLQRELIGMPRALTDKALSVRQISWVESLTVSGVFVALMLGLSCWWFATKDY